MILDNQFVISLIVGLAVGAASGFLGAFMILKRMALVGDALTHVALPGIGLALILGINPFIGAFGVLFLAMLLVWKLEQRTDLPVETIVGIFFAASLAIGILITPDLELYEALFGDISAVKLLDGVSALIIAGIVFAVMVKISDKMLMGIISEDLAVSSGIKIRKLNFIFLLLVITIVALGVKVVGTLLMGGLVIIPAAAARNISRSFRQFAFGSACFGLLSAGIGIYLAKLFSIPPGPAVILSSAIFFLLSLALKRR
jgi:ABC-type Mn2+/Zn2+ transport system permease subunit